jgi:hypothetical protein
MVRLGRLLVLVSRVYYWIIIVFGIIAGISMVAFGAILASSQDMERMTIKGVDKAEWLSLINVLKTGSIVLGILYIISSFGAARGLRRQNIWLLLQFVIYEFIAAACCVAYVVVFIRKLQEGVKRANNIPDANYFYSDNGIFYFGFGTGPVLLILATLILYQDFNRQKKLQREQSAANSKTESPLGYPSSFSPNGSEPYPKASSTTKAYA